MAHDVDLGVLLQKDSTPLPCRTTILTMNPGVIPTCRKNVVEKVLRLLKRKERWLVVAGVRFLRTCIGTKDDFYMRHLTKNSLLDPVMHVFFENGDRYNLLNSAVLELVDFIRRENIKVGDAHGGGVA